MAKMDLETFDFYSEPSGREAIFARENGKCFYCLALLNDRNRVIDHILPVACGDNTYRNCVAACLSCNSEKGETSGEEFLRVLCRKGRLSAEEFDSRYRLLQSIQIGLEKPEL